MTLLEDIELVELAYGNPEQAIVRASESVRAREADGDRLGTSRALRALGLARRGTNDLTGAEQAILRAIDLAGGDAECLAAARATMAGVHVLAGRLDPAEAECRSALELGDVPSRGYATAQLGLVQLRRGQSEQALASFDVAIALADTVGDRMTGANARTNRAILLAYAGRTNAATTDLQCAREVYRNAGQRLAAAGAAANLGFVLGRAGEVPQSLRAFDAAEAEFSALGLPLAELLLDRAEVLLAAGLVDDAARQTKRCIDAFREADMGASLAEAIVVLARAQLLAHDVAGARGTAGRARDHFERQHRPLWGATASLIDLESGWLAGHIDDDLLAVGLEVGNRLFEAGLVAEADRALLRTAQVAERLGEKQIALDCLERLCRPRRGLSLQERATREHARALLAAWSGRDRDVDRHLRAGVQALTTLQSTLGSGELRAGVGRLRADLVALGLQRAIETGGPAAAVRWLARGRRVDHVRRRRDTEVERVLTQVRAAAADRADWARQGGTDADLVRRHHDLEREATRLLRRQTGQGARDGNPVSVRSIRRAVEDRTVVEFFDHDGFVWAVAITPTTLDLLRCGRSASVRTDTQYLRTALRRLREPDSSAASIAAARQSALASADALSRQLFGEIKLGRHAGVVVSPPADLFDLPWMALPCFVDHSVWVTPGLCHWLHDQASDERPGGAQGVAVSAVGFVAGPRLTYADAEVRRLAELYDAPTMAIASGATAEAVRRLIERSAYLHIAAHGRFRADAPIFSSIELVDGPLLLAELEDLTAAPRSVVLATCDSGRSGVQPGDEAIGLVRAFLSLGARHVVASVLPIDDRGALPVLLDVHESLVRCGDPTTGLVGSPLALSNESRLEDVTRASFVCFGAP